MHHMSPCCLHDLQNVEMVVAVCSMVNVVVASSDVDDSMLQYASILVSSHSWYECIPEQY